MSKEFELAKDKALKTAQKDIDRYFAKRGKYSEYDLRDKAVIQSLTDFPTDCKSIRYLDVKFKAILLKAQLQKEFPKAEIKVRIDRYSMGASIDAWIKGEKEDINESRASQIGNLYQDRGQTDTMTDYFDFDNYVHIMFEHGGVVNSIVQFIGKEMP